ncbi:Na+/H+ antiporter subunit E [Nocardiopsis ansamitocini]|uniref:Na+/H+ antiporter subunit E n=1 Tax=Nocardiopsis ansamitocini TaxID=1670832 RepID=A0A9W6P6Q7_9ACTN|nr:Na+/H+ antiporter subunit E [Nocardiopsis ansamitocini]GLU48058.1 hypothetical protein Nans01_24090 [Nocardiopsis ansamitocini]
MTEGVIPTTYEQSESTSAIDGNRPWYRRLVARVPTVLLLAAMWVTLWGDPSPGTILAGIMVGTLCYSVAKLPHFPVRLGFSPFYATKLAGKIGLDLLLSSTRVAFHVLWRPARVRGAIVAVPMRTNSDFLLAMVSGSMSLITGSLVIELNREQGVIYVHGFPAASEAEADRLRNQIAHTEELLVRAFGTRSDIAELEARTPAAAERTEEGTA